MTALRTRFLEDMPLHGYSPKTQSCYVSAVRGLARFYVKSLELLSEEELRRYFLLLTLEKKVARATATIALCGIKFLFQNTLQRNWTCFKLLRPPKQKKLPVVLSPEEVQKILPCVRTPIYRVCLTTIYSCGLRLSEGLFLQVTDVDSQRMLLRIRGKGNKDRLVPLPQRTLEQLRGLWRTHHSATWLFPAINWWRAWEASVLCNRFSK
jgi:integrase/recombinase XerD